MKLSWLSGNHVTELGKTPKVRRHCQALAPRAPQPSGASSSETQGHCSAPLAHSSELTGTEPHTLTVVGGSRLECHSCLHAVLRADAGLQTEAPTGGLREGLSSCEVAPPCRGPAAADSRGSRRCYEASARGDQATHSSEAGEALIRLLQVPVDFYIFLFGID